MEFVQKSLIIKCLLFTNNEIYLTSALKRLLGQSDCLLNAESKIILVKGLGKTQYDDMQQPIRSRTYEIFRDV